MYFDTEKLMECVNWERITGDKVIINVDGEKLRETIYEEVHVTIEREDDYIRLYSNNELFCNIIPGSIFSEDDCKQLAIEIKNMMNNRIRSKLNMK